MPRRHYSWKLCPYSTHYKELFYDAGFRGSSTNQDLQGSPWSALPVSDHTITDGKMIFKYSVCNGWMCDDPSCYYYIAYGAFYTES